MNRENLKIELNKLAIPESYYSLYDQLEDDRLILYHSYSEWQVFYYERGQKYDYQVFDSEAEACFYIYKNLKSLKDTYDTLGLGLPH